MIHCQYPVPRWKWHGQYDYHFHHIHRVFLNRPMFDKVSEKRSQRRKFAGNRRFFVLLVQISQIAPYHQGINLVGAESELVSVVGRETILREAIESAETDYDYLLIDCPPSTGFIYLSDIFAIVLPKANSYSCIASFFAAKSNLAV